jgi:hypothetical protein
MNRKSQIIILHIIGSLAFLSIPVFSSPDFNSGQNLFEITPFLQNFLRYILLLLYFYLSHYWLLPKLFFQNKKIVFFIVTLIVLFVVLKIPDLLFPFEFNHHRPPRMRGAPRRMLFHFFEGGFFQFFFVGVISYLFKINHHFDLVKNEKQVAEISYLKAQINPHFLFNTLNSLYALTITKSDEAPQAVLKLSSMMRYVVTESTQEFVTLQKEINYINDYIDLQKLRMEESTNFSYTITGNPIGKTIAPLILIPFIENAFKYGLNPEENSNISIQITIQNNKLILEAKNKMVVHEVPDDLKTEKGIENTTKRLEFMYPNKHSLSIKEENNTYCILLEINLI